MTVSIDYDETLSKPHVQEYAMDLIARGIDVWVLTFRYDELHKHMYIGWNPTNDDMYEVTDRVGIPRHKIIFTNMGDKGDYLLNTHVLWHLDDDYRVMNSIRHSKCRTVGIQVNSGSWKNKCERLIRLNQ